MIVQSVQSLVEDGVNCLCNSSKKQAHNFLDVVINSILFLAVLGKVRILLA